MVTARQAFGRRAWWILALCAGLAGCGGGGGSEPPPAAIEGNFFPLAVGDVWMYSSDRLERVVVRATGTAQAEGKTGVVVGVDDAATGASTAVYLVTAAGVRQVPVSNADPLTQAIGAIDLMHYPLHAGDRFVQIDRTISTGVDFDGDGRIEMAQVRSDVEVLGLEEARTPVGNFGDSLHLRTSIRVGVPLSGQGQTVTLESTVDDWYVRDLGPVRTSMRTVSQGISDERTLGLTAYRVGNRRSDSAPPALQTLAPAAGSTQGQPASVRVIFDEALDPATLAAAITLRDGHGAAVAGTVEPGVNSLTFWPSAPLASGHYVASVGAGVADLLGNTLGSTRSWSFDIDAVGPQLVAVTPALGAVDVARNASITLVFDEPLDPASLSPANVALYAMASGDAPVTVSVAGTTVTVTPTAPLARGVAYTLVLGANTGYGPRDLYGNYVFLSTAARFTTDFGRFAAPVSLQPEAGAEAVAVGDVNGDGRSDVVVAVGHDPVAAQAFRLAVYLQQAGGGLAGTPQWLATRSDYACRPTSVAIGDVNGDGRQDVVVAEFGCGVEVFLQGADGLLRPGPWLPSAQSFLVRLADFNADGRLDLIAVGWNDVTARLWLQGAGGVLEEAGLPAVETSGWGTMATGDLDGDGRADFVVTSGQGTTAKAVGVVLQHADGSFAAPIYLAASELAIDQGVAIGDADGDGRAELVVAMDRQIQFWRLQGSALLRTREIAITGAVGPLVLTDVNGDGRADIVIAHSGGCGMGVVLQRADGSHGGEVCYTGYAPWPQPDVLAVGDISGDGRPDIVLAKSVLVQRVVGAFAEGARRPGAGTAALIRQLLQGPTR